MTQLCNRYNLYQHGYHSVDKCLLTYCIYPSQHVTLFRQLYCIDMDNTMRQLPEQVLRFAILRSHSPDVAVYVLNMETDGITPFPYRVSTLDDDDLTNLAKYEQYCLYNIYIGLDYYSNQLTRDSQYYIYSFGDMNDLVLQNEYIYSAQISLYEYDNSQKRKPLKLQRYTIISCDGPCDVQAMDAIFLTFSLHKYLLKTLIDYVGSSLKYTSFEKLCTKNTYIRYINRLDAVIATIDY